MVKEQKHTENYSIYNGDCMDVIRQIESDSIHLSVYSPPFAGLYNYSSSEKDFSNCDSKEEFLQQYEYLISEIYRITMPGRISVVHCQNIKDSKTENMWNFPAEVVRMHIENGFNWKDQITIWKEPLKVRMRTMVRSLMHKLIVEDSTECFTAMPDYLLIFKKDGENPIPVTHEFGLTHYAGARPFLPEHEATYGKYNLFKKKWKGFKGDPKENKLSHLTWQRYASSVWDDIRIDNVLKYKESKEQEDEKHVHPLQLDVIDRCIDLWSNKKETVFTPFMGVGSEVYGAVSMGRRAIGAELKTSYYNQAVKNLSNVEDRFVEDQLSLL